MTLRAGNSSTNNGSASAGVAQITLEKSSSFNQLGLITFEPWLGEQWRA
jgi:hypothetical protein